MKCYQHRDADAIGICKACGKGLCEKCIVNADFGITCSEKCTKEVTQGHKLITNAVTLYSGQKKTSLLHPLFVISMGVLFLIFGIQEELWAIIPVGILFFSFGVGLLVTHLKSYQEIKKDSL